MGFTMPKADFYNIKESAQKTYDKLQSGKHWIIVFDNNVAAQYVVDFQKWFFPVDKDGFQAVVAPMRIGDEQTTALTFLIVSKGKVRPDQMASYMQQISNTPVTTDAMREQDYLFWVADDNSAEMYGQLFNMYLDKRKD